MKSRHTFIAEAIRNSAAAMRREADRLEVLAARLETEKDLGYVNEAVSVITSAPQAIRLDVIISRLLRSEG